ncbi:hypothetical protein GCM10010199_71680 [Dactylosporangium roseum]
MHGGLARVDLPADPGIAESAAFLEVGQQRGEIPMVLVHRRLLSRGRFGRGGGIVPVEGDKRPGTQAFALVRTGEGVPASRMCGPP